MDKNTGRVHYDLSLLEIKIFLLLQHILNKVTMVYIVISQVPSIISIPVSSCVSVRPLLP